MPAQYPIRAAAKLTGIAVDTLRAWERRYQAVTPERTARGRLYSDADIRRLVLLRSALEGGHAIGQVASLADAELQDLSRAFNPWAGSPLKPSVTAAPLPELRPLMDAIEAFDSVTLNDELGRLALLVDPATLVHKVVLPLVRLAGERWEKGTLQVAQEHLLSACVRNLLGGLVRLQRPGNGSRRLLLTTPSSELHEFGILAAAMLAVARGYQVDYLGPNLPAAEILSAAQKCAPQAVVLGVMRVNATPTVRQDVNRLASELPASTELWLGGSGSAAVIDGTSSRRTFLLEDLADFERHLTRVKANFSPEAAL